MTTEERLGALETKMQEMLDRQAIFDCIKRSSRGNDRFDTELVASSFHPDAIHDNGRKRVEAYGYPRRRRPVVSAGPAPRPKVNGSDFMLTGRTAIVAGAARGLGRAIALRLACDGAAVSAWDLNSQGARETAKMIADAGGRAIGLECNSAKADEIARGIAETHSQLGKVSILVNNAALSPFKKFQEITEQVWDDLMAINLKGPFLCCQAVIPDMLEANWGRIINISSSSAQTGSAHQTHYAASKAGVIGFTKSLAMEFAGTGITVNNVPPGFVNTEGLQEAPVDIDGFAQRTPMKRPGRPENIAAAVAFLASEDADYITGHTLSVNGGRYLN